MSEGVDTVVLYNQLAYHDVLPVAWQARERPLSRFEIANLEESNLLLLQAAAAVEEHPIRDQSEDAGPLAGEIARLDLKLNLVLQLLARLVLKDRLPVPAMVQFNAHGACWTSIGSPPEVGAAGVLRIHLHVSLPQSLDLPGTITEVEGSQVRVRFQELSDSVAELIQRLAFLRHRREVADARKARESAQDVGN